MSTVRRREQAIAGRLIRPGIMAGVRRKRAPVAQAKTTRSPTPSMLCLPRFASARIPAPSPLGSAGSPMLGAVDFCQRGPLCPVGNRSSPVHNPSNVDRPSSELRSRRAPPVCRARFRGRRGRVVACARRQWFGQDQSAEIAGRTGDAGRRRDSLVRQIDQRGRAGLSARPAVPGPSRRSEGRTHRPGESGVRRRARRLPSGACGCHRGPGPVRPEGARAPSGPVSFGRPEASRAAGATDDAQGQALGAGRAFYGAGYTGGGNAGKIGGRTSCGRRYGGGYQSSGRAPGRRQGDRAVRALWAVVRRDLLLAMRRKTEVLTALFFFVIVTSLFPLGIGPEPALLRKIAPGVLWVGALLATMLGLQRMFAAG